MNWEGLERFHIPLGSPLLVVKGGKGYLSCAYLSATACAGEACAIVRGVKTHEDMLSTKIIEVTEEAKRLGVIVGMLGREALEIFR